MHRVLLDFTCDASHISDDSRLVATLRELLVGDGWNTEQGEEEHAVINRMAVQLPDSDVAGFVRNTRSAMSRKGPHSELTLGYYIDGGLGKIRLRIRCDIDAFLAELGRRTANRVLEELPELRLTQMDLFQERHDQPIMQGGEILREGFRLTSMKNLTIVAPFVVSLGFLTVGALVAHSLYWSDSQTEIMGDSLWIWYGRLFGPMLMALITTSSTIFREYREDPPVRLATWHVGTT